MLLGISCSMNWSPRSHQRIAAVHRPAALCRRCSLRAKPILRVAGDSGADASAAKKAAKRLTFVPVGGELDGFLAGRADLDQLALLQERIGVHGLAERAAIHNRKDDAEPYRVGFFRFEPTAGLWCLAQGSGSELDLFAGLLENLSALGERSSGTDSPSRSPTAFRPNCRRSLTQQTTRRTAVAGLTTAHSPPTRVGTALARCHLPADSPATVSWLPQPMPTRRCATC